LAGQHVADSPIKLVVGLGNPGEEYARTRHNAGFWYVDALARAGGGQWRRESRYQAELARTRIGADELWLEKPLTFMNRSGSAVQAVATFYRIAPAEILVVHDEIDLPAGTVRLKQGGGHGGHNGLRDIIAHIGADFWRLRLGVGRPAEADEVIDFVLKRAGASEQALIDAAMERGLAALPELLRDGAQKVMHRLHTKTDSDPL
jgi:PTH1 family peptidyl-tRNA hydrolase